jgi:hypothetical protein
MPKPYLWLYDDFAAYLLLQEMWPIREAIWLKLEHEPNLPKRFGRLYALNPNEPKEKAMPAQTNQVNNDITDHEFLLDIALEINEAINKRLQLVVVNNNVKYRVVSHYETVIETREYKDAEAAYNGCE